MKYTSSFVLSSIAAFAISATAVADPQGAFDAGKKAAFEAVAEKNKLKLETARKAALGAVIEEAESEGAGEASTSTGSTDGRCVDGISAGTFSCHNIDLLSHIDIVGLGVSFVNDIWGWTDSRTRREYVLLGATEGTVVIDITWSRRPIVVGMLPAATLDPDRPFWRDIKVFQDHAFVVSEQTDHGMQVLDLSVLRDLNRPDNPVALEAVAQYNEFSTSHNIVINEDSGFAYVVGANTCLGGLEMIDIRDPANPINAGCFSDHGYIHDAQCVNYSGPDERYHGREICFSASANAGDDGTTFFNTLSIVDVTDKDNLEIIANQDYGDGFGFSHQGWLTPDQGYYLHDDELDEFFGAVTTTTTRLWDLSDLRNPAIIAETTNGQTSIDHNLYTRDHYSFNSNYTSGLRIFDTSGVGDGVYDEVAFFDMYPENDDPTFEGGTWSNFPYFRHLRRVIAVSSIDRGLFLLQPQLR